MRLAVRIAEIASKEGPHDTEIHIDTILNKTEIRSTSLEDENSSVLRCRPNRKKNNAKPQHVHTFHQTK